MVKISPQKHIIKSASASTKSLSSSTTNSSDDSAISQLTAPIRPKTNQQPPQIIYNISDEGNKPMSPWLRLAGSVLATAGVIGGIVLGLEHHHNGQIRKAVLPHLQKYMSADNELHIANSIKPRTEIHKLCKELLTRPDLSQEDKNVINTFLKTLKIDPLTGSIEETHLLMKNEATHYIDGLTVSDIEIAAIKLEELFSTGLEKPIELSEKDFEHGDLSKEVEKRKLQEMTVRAIQEYLGKISHTDNSMPAYELSKDYLALKVSVRLKSNGEIEVLNSSNKPFNERTNFSNYRFSSLIPQSSTSYYSDPLLSHLMLFEMFNLFNSNRY